MNKAAGVAAAGGVLILFALLFDAAPLFVPGLGLVFMGLGTPVWISIAARGARVHRHLHSDRVVEDEPLEATIEVSRGPWGLPGGELQDPLAGAPVSLRGWLAPITGERTANVRVVARFARRGRVSVDPPSLVVHDPLELACAVRSAAVPADEVLVLPRTERVHWLGRDLAHPDAAQGRSPSEPLAAVEVDGLRPYRVGTPASRIHWPALARGAGLLERRLAADGDSRPLVVLDARCSGPAEHLDAAVRAAASLVLELTRGGGCSLLLPGDRRPMDIDSGLGSWPAAHVRLALIEPSAGQAPALAAGARRGKLFYISAQPIERLPARLASSCDGIGVLVLPTPVCDRMSAAPAFEVTGCRGYVLGARPRSLSRERAA
ncbi:MAG TPA: DUF58 domain-containing protein [Solirubrobacteraceae bacterium]